MEASISMEIVNPHAAGIDIGSRSHWVAVGQSEQDVREFGVFNQDLFTLAEWLKERHIKTIAMKSTGTYWQTCMRCLLPGVFMSSCAMGNSPRISKGKRVM